MTTNSCAAHAMHRESQMPHEDIRPSRAAGDAVLEFGRFRLLLRRRQLIADGVPIELGSRVLAGSGKTPEFSKGCRSVGVPWMPGTRQRKAGHDDLP